MKTADYWIKKLNLEKHPEGGYFRETYRSAESIDTWTLPDRYKGNRVFTTAIYFLVTFNHPSRFHRLKSDEIWHFYTGSPLTLHLISDDGALNQIKLGPKVASDEQFQFTVKKGLWFAATVETKGDFSLCGCQVSPGFEFTDFEMGNTKKLIQQFPQHRDLILKINNEV